MLIFYKLFPVILKDVSTQCGNWVKYEWAHDKTNKMNVCLAKTQISLSICPIWSEPSLSAGRKLGSLATHCTAKTMIRLGGCSSRSEFLHIHFVGFFMCWLISLRKHAYSNILKILPPKNENFQIKNSYILHISDQNIDYGYSLEPPHRGGSNEYPQSMFLAEIRKIMFTPVYPSFTI